jgi:hypothetical protein
MAQPTLAGSVVETAAGQLNPLPIGRRVLFDLCFVLLVVSLTSWRLRSYYTGSLDPVVAAKALLGLGALAIASYLAVSARKPASQVGARSVVVVALFLSVSVVGSLAVGSFFASLVLAVRVAVIAFTVFCLVMATDLEQVLQCAFHSLAAVGVVLALTGVPSVLHGGRLSGGLLPANPNQIALLFGPPAIGCLWRMVNERKRPYDPIWFLALLALTWLTGSRTGLIALIVAITIVLMMAPRVHAIGFVCLTLLAPALFYLTFFSGLLSGYFNRGGSHDVMTLSSRTIAWDAAFSAQHGFWQTWFGGGLAVKTVAVKGQYWNTQVLDSSWVSAYVTAGVIGIALLCLWVLTSLVCAIRTTAPYRSLLLALICYAVTRSITETGLLDSYVLFVVMLLPALASDLKPFARH